MNVYSYLPIFCILYTDTVYSNLAFFVFLYLLGMLFACLYFFFFLHVHCATFLLVMLVLYII